MLIITADDYGRDKTTTDNTLKCFFNARITSASAMVFMLDSERAASSARDTGLEIGLHVNFSLPFTARNVPPKLREHQHRLVLYLKKNRLSRVFFNPLLRDAFNFVYSSQREEFQRLYSKLPEFYNGHHHMHLCTNMLLGNHLPKGARIRRTFTIGHRQKGFINRIYSDLLNSYISGRFISTDAFFNLEPIHDQERLKKITERAADEDVEIGVHPWREEETGYLLSDRFQALISSVQLGSFSRLPAKYL